MKIENIIRKISVVSTIAVMVIVTAILAGCQKEKDEETTYRLEVKKIDDSFQTVRLKSGTESSRYKIAEFTLTSLNNFKSVFIKCGVIYDVEFKGSTSGFASTVNMSSPPISGGWTKEMDYSKKTDYETQSYRLTPQGASNEGHQVNFEHKSDGAGIVTIYEYY